MKLQSTATLKQEKLLAEKVGEELSMPNLFLRQGVSEFQTGVDKSSSLILIIQSADLFRYKPQLV